ncbi:hypothetical protein HDU93_002698 [Gonapodya sp. JEL0774]|nr:hypothetical protein HDU93_002698 [Gonapodya sp. JEL0774]
MGDTNSTSNAVSNGATTFGDDRARELTEAIRRLTQTLDQTATRANNNDNRLINELAGTLWNRMSAVQAAGSPPAGKQEARDLQHEAVDYYRQAATANSLISTFIASVATASIFQLEPDDDRNLPALVALGVTLALSLTALTMSALLLVYSIRRLVHRARYYRRTLEIVATFSRAALLVATCLRLATASQALAYGVGAATAAMALAAFLLRVTLTGDPNYRRVPVAPDEAELLDGGTHGQEARIYQRPVPPPPLLPRMMFPGSEGSTVSNAGQISFSPPPPTFGRMLFPGSEGSTVGNAGQTSLVYPPPTLMSRVFPWIPQGTQFLFPGSETSPAPLYDPAVLGTDTMGTGARQRPVVTFGPTTRISLFESDSSENDTPSTDPRSAGTGAPRSYSSYVSPAHWFYTQNAAGVADPQNSPLSYSGPPLPVLHPYSDGSGSVSVGDKFDLKIIHPEGWGVGVNQTNERNAILPL